MSPISQKERDDLDNRFNHHPPISEEAGRAFSTVRRECRNLAVVLSSLCPDGREKSLAITKLEEAMFWANGAIARNQTDAVQRFLLTVPQV